MTLATDNALPPKMRSLVLPDHGPTVCASFRWLGTSRNVRCRLKRHSDTPVKMSGG
jgi:hypothetical protein